jgi:hypothetical protein
MKNQSPEPHPNHTDLLSVVYNGVNYSHHDSQYFKFRVAIITLLELVAVIFFLIHGGPLKESIISQIINLLPDVVV